MSDLEKMSIDDLYNLLAESRLGVAGAEKLLPLAEEILKILKRKIADLKRRKKQYEEMLLIRRWAKYREDARLLRHRLEIEKNYQNGLAWLVYFFIDHASELLDLYIDFSSDSSLLRLYPDGETKEAIFQYPDFPNFCCDLVHDFLFFDCDYQPPEPEPELPRKKKTDDEGDVDLDPGFGFNF